jgi:hypothetical protein
VVAESNILDVTICRFTQEEARKNFLLVEAVDDRGDNLAKHWADSRDRNG